MGPPIFPASSPRDRLQGRGPVHGESDRDGGPTMAVLPVRDNQQDSEDLRVAKIGAFGMMLASGGFTRALRRLSGRWRARGIHFVRAPKSSLGLAAIGVDERRADRIQEFLIAEALVSERRLLAAPTASVRELARVHDLDYLASLQLPCHSI